MKNAKANGKQAEQMCLYADSAIGKGGRKMAKDQFEKSVRAGTEPIFYLWLYVQHQAHILTHKGHLINIVEWMDVQVIAAIELHL